MARGQKRGREEQVWAAVTAPEHKQAAPTAAYVAAVNCQAAPHILCVSLLLKCLLKGESSTSKFHYTLS